MICLWITLPVIHSFEKDREPAPAHCHSNYKENTMNIIHQIIGLILLVRTPRDERGLSQSTENAILLAGAAAIALIIITVITQYVKSNLPS